MRAKTTTKEINLLIIELRRQVPMVRKLRDRQLMAEIHLSIRKLRWILEKRAVDVNEGSVPATLITQSRWS